MREPAFYCHYCDAMSERRTCEHCGGRAQPMRAVDDAYYREGRRIAEARQALLTSPDEVKP